MSIQKGVRVLTVLLLLLIAGSLYAGVALAQDMKGDIEVISK